MVEYGFLVSIVIDGEGESTWGGTPRGRGAGQAGCDRKMAGDSRGVILPYLLHNSHSQAQNDLEE
jgi:hypothetical protein